MVNLLRPKVLKATGFSNQVQNKQRVTEISETNSMILKLVSNFHPIIGVLAYTLSTFKKINRLKSLILSVCEKNKI
jgi:hypothetical protein